MLVVMRRSASEEEIAGVAAAIRGMGYTPHVIPGATRTAIGITGNQGPVGRELLQELPGVQEVISVTRSYKLASREVKPEDTIIELSREELGTRLGGQRFTVIAGPCALESYEQALTTARGLKALGVKLFRGALFKPRTSPYSFQGLGVEGLSIMDAVRRETGMLMVSEAVDAESLELLAPRVEMLQIGARNMQNYSLLKLAGRCGKPVLLKRGASATLEELFLAAEYILNEGNYQVLLCERGLRTFADHNRNTLDLSVVPAVKEISHLPIIVDPSHGTGRRAYVGPLSRAALAVGASGILVEVHPRPAEALSDGFQSLSLDEFGKLMGTLKKLAAALSLEMS